MAKEVASVSCWQAIREAANELDQMAVQTVEKACDIGDMLRAVRLTMDAESFVQSIERNLSRGKVWAYQMITLSFRRHAALTCENPTAAYEEVKSLSPPEEEVMERKKWPREKRGPKKGSGGRPKNAAKRRVEEPKFSTVNIYFEAGLIPSAKSGGQTKRLNQEVERIAPGAIANKDAGRVMEAAQQIRLERDPDTAIADAAVAAEEARDALPKTAQQKLDRAVKLHVQAEYMKLQRKFNEQLAAAVAADRAEIERAKQEAYRLEQAAKEEYEAANQYRLGVDSHMTQDEFKLVLSCLHSDKQPEEMRPRYDRAFQIFKRLEKTVNTKLPIAELRRRGWERVSPFNKKH